MVSKLIIQILVAITFVLMSIAAYTGSGNIFKSDIAHLGFTLMLCTLAICHSIEKRK